MSLLQNRNVIQLSLSGHSSQAAISRFDAANSSALSVSATDSPRSLRFAANPALAHLKAQSPRLTAAQRKSIALLQEHEATSGLDDQRVGLLDPIQGPRVFSAGETVLQRRANFKVV